MPNVSRDRNLVRAKGKTHAPPSDGIGVNYKEHQKGSVRDESIPVSLQSILVSFSCCFTKPSFDNFITLVIGWIVCPGRHSISRVLQAADRLASSKHFSSYYRFLSRGRWEADRLGLVVLKLLLPCTPREIPVAIDDTLSHRSGSHIFGGGMHHDACRSTYGRGNPDGGKKFFSYGQNWVVLSIWVPCPWDKDRGWAVPILFRLYRSSKLCPKAKHRKRTELAAEMVSILAKWLPEGRTVHLAGDSEYACNTVVSSLPENVTFTGPMRMDAAIYDRVGKKKPGRGRPPVRGPRLPTPKQLAEDASVSWTTSTMVLYGREVTLEFKTLTCMWYRVGGPEIVRMIVTNDPRGKFEQRAFFCTDTSVEVEVVLAQFARRWEIEVAFREAKQSLGLQDPQNGWWRRKHGSKAPPKRPGPNPKGRRGEQAALHTFPLVYTVYAIVIIWYLKNGKPEREVQRVRKRASWYRHKASPSFMDMLEALRRSVWSARISRDPGLRPLRQKILNLIPGVLLAA